MAWLKRVVLDTTPLRTSREFRYVFIARTISIFGIGILLVAVPVQVYELSGSTLGVASVSTVLGVSLFAGTLVGGVLADRRDRRKLIALARATAGVCFAVLAINAMAPSPQLWVIYVCAAFDGFSGGISSTALMAVTPSLVPKDKLAAAGALTSLMADLGSVASPALGGVVIATFDVSANYVFATIATIVTTICITRLPPLPPPGTETGSPWQSITSGFRYAASDRTVGGVLLIGFFAMALTGWNVLLPGYVHEVLHMGPEVVGVLYSGPALGALLGSLTSGWTGTVRRSGLCIFIAALLAAAGLAGTGLTATAVVGFVGLMAHGFGRVIGDILRFALIQQRTPEQFRGRIAGVWSAQVTTGTAVGTMVAGGIATLFGMSTAFLIYGIAGCVAVLVLMASLGTLRRTVGDTADAQAAEPVPAGAGGDES